MGLVKLGPNTLTLDGNNTFTGTAVINGGTLSFGSLTSATLGGLAGTGNVDLPSGVLTVGGNNPDTVYAGTFTGSGTLEKIGTHTLTLDAPGMLPSTLTLVDLSGNVIPGGLPALPAITAITGTLVTLTAPVADPYGDCTGVTLTLTDAASNVVFSQTVNNQNGRLQSGLYSAVVDTAGWAPGAYTFSATATFADNGNPAPASTMASATLNLTADTAIISCGTPGYQEYGTGWETVVDPAVYGGQYRQTSTSGAYATYTFTGLAPGTYELWANYVASGGAHPTSVPAAIYDGGLGGTSQQTFTMNQTVAATEPGQTWGWQEFDGDGHQWGWLYDPQYAVGTVYINSSTLTVKVQAPYLGTGTEAPALRLIADPAPEAPYSPGALGGREVSQDPDEVSSGQIVDALFPNNTGETLHGATGGWPHYNAGLIADSGGETWCAVNSALAVGGRGLPGGITLAGLLRRHGLWK